MHYFTVLDVHIFIREVNSVCNTRLFFFFSLAAQGANVWLDISSVNAAIVKTFNSACERYYQSLESKTKSKTKMSDDSNGWSGGPTGIYRVSPISLAKAVKNDSELEGMRSCHLRSLFPPSNLIMCIIIFACFPYHCFVDFFVDDAEAELLASSDN